MPIFGLRHREHLGAQRQGKDAEQGGEHNAPGGKLLIVTELHRKHRGDGSGGAALKQQHDLCGHPEAEQPQQSKGPKAEGWDDQHPHGGQFPDGAAADDAL